jgi:hypothetical protein
MPGEAKAVIVFAGALTLSWASITALRRIGGVARAV